jgi:Zn-dependent metalloprotease
MVTHVNCIHCITPPYIIEKIIEKGSPKQKEQALRALRISAQMRGWRQTRSGILFMVPSLIPGNKNRLVYDAGNGSELPGRLVRSEGDAVSGNPAVDEAYDGAGYTYDLYNDVFERNSIDGEGMKLISTVHYMQDYDNAFWDGEQMVYGDGDEGLPEDERLFNRFTIAVDIIGHELTHGVIEYTSKLAYWDQPGALNESFSDVFGSLVKQRMLNQSARDADWLIGEGLFTANVNGKALRSMKEPGTAYDDPVIGKDPQPGHLKDYNKTTSDNGGVHINSGIPNRAFFYAAMEIDGYAWEKAGKIWYYTLRDKLNERSDFQDVADKTFQVAGELFGKRSLEQKAVAMGWNKVGIDVNENAKTGCLDKIKNLSRN